MSRLSDSVPLRRGLLAILCSTLLLFAAYSWVQGQSQSPPAHTYRGLPRSEAGPARAPIAQATQGGSADVAADFPPLGDSAGFGGYEGGADSQANPYAGLMEAGMSQAVAVSDRAQEPRVEMIILKSDWASGEDSDLRRAAREAIQRIVEGALRSRLTLSRQQQEQIPRKPTRFLFPDGLAVFYKTEHLMATLSWMREHDLVQLERSGDERRPAASMGGDMPGMGYGMGPAGGGMGGMDSGMGMGEQPPPLDSPSHRWEAELTFGNFTLHNDGFRLPGKLTSPSDPPDPLRMKILSGRSLVSSQPFFPGYGRMPGGMMGGMMPGSGMMPSGMMPGVGMTPMNDVTMGGMGMEMGESGTAPQRDPVSLVNIMTNLLEKEVIQFPVESVLDSRALVSLRSTLNVADGESVVLPWFGSIGVIRELFLAQGVDPLLVIHGAGGADRNQPADSTRQDGSPAISVIRGPLRIERLQSRTDGRNTDDFVEQLRTSASEAFSSPAPVPPEPELPSAPTTAPSAPQAFSSPSPVPPEPELPSAPTAAPAVPVPSPYAPTVPFGAPSPEPSRERSSPPIVLSDLEHLAILINTVRQQVAQAEQSAIQQAGRVRRLTEDDPNREAAMESLRKLVEESVASRVRLQRLESQSLRQRLARLESKLDEREELTEAITAHRMKHLLDVRPDELADILRQLEKQEQRWLERANNVE